MSDEQIARYDGVLEPLPSEKAQFDEKGYRMDCADRADICCYDFSTDRKGFSACIDMDRENLVFFSIPYQEGWRAYVNGEEALVEKVNVGFMAVKCGAGHSDIRFEFETPMLKLGTAATVSTCLAFAVYALFYAYDTERGKNRRFRRFVVGLRRRCHINPPQAVTIVHTHEDSFAEDVSDASEKSPVEMTSSFEPDTDLTEDGHDES